MKFEVDRITRSLVLSIEMIDVEFGDGFWSKCRNLGVDENVTGVGIRDGWI